MAEPVDKTMITPNSNKTIISGSNQNFLRSLRKAHKSFNISIAIFSKVFLNLLKYNYDPGFEKPMLYLSQIS